MADHAGVYNALIRQKQSDQPQPQQQEQQQRHPTLAVVHPHASCVINCPIEDAWKATRQAHARFKVECLMMSNVDDKAESSAMLAAVEWKEQ